MVTRATISYFIIILFSVSTSYSDTSNPLRITIYPSRIDELGIGSNKVIITKNQIAQSTAKNLPELLSQQTGIQNISYMVELTILKLPLVLEVLGSKLQWIPLYS